MNDNTNNTPSSGVANFFFMIGIVFVGGIFLCDGGLKERMLCAFVGAFFLICGITQTGREVKEIQVEEQEKKDKLIRATVPLERRIGSVVFTATAGGRPFLWFYRREDNTSYYKYQIKETNNQYNEYWFDGCPTVAVHENYDISERYHPAEVIYTGASSGGIHMGNVTTFEAYRTVEVHKNKKGRVSIGYLDFGLTNVDAIRFEEPFREKYQGHPIYQKYVRNSGKFAESLVFIIELSMGENTLLMNHLSNAAHNNSMAGLTKFLNDHSYDFSDCLKIKEFIEEVMKSEQ